MNTQPENQKPHNQKIQTVTAKWRAVETLNAIISICMIISVLGKKAPSPYGLYPIVSIALCAAMTSWKLFGSLPTPGTHSPFICFRVLSQVKFAEITLAIGVTYSAVYFSVLGYPLTEVIWVAKVSVDGTFLATIGFLAIGSLVADSVLLIIQTARRWKPSRPPSNNDTANPTAPAANRVVTLTDVIPRNSTSLS